MTHEEIIALAKRGGFVTLRAKIVDIEEPEYPGKLSLKVDEGNGNLSGWVFNDSIISIEPRPETDAEKIARLEARIAALEAKDLAPGWIEWSGGENPAQGKTVRYRMRDGNESSGSSNNLRWTHKDSITDIIAYQVID